MSVKTQIPGYRAGLKTAYQLNAGYISGVAQAQEWQQWEQLPFLT
jgi:hypothetical protein